MESRARIPHLTRVDGPTPDPADAGEQVLAAIASVRFGSVEVVVHEGRVVQIVRTEKLRLER